MGFAFLERLCDHCKHRHLGTHPPTCAAFPQRIPLEIRMMYVDHRQPYPGDNDITFEPRDQSPATLEEVARVKLRSRPESAEPIRRQLRLEEQEDQPA
jgi:hypothetical protein